MRRIYIDHCHDNRKLYSVFTAEILDTRPVSELIETLKKHWSDPKKLLTLLRKTHTIVHLGEDVVSSVFEADGSWLCTGTGGTFSAHWYFTLKGGVWTCNRYWGSVNEETRWGYPPGHVRGATL